jgi:tRNA-splicing ligase RtcB (3'-phosphate/5'-hydroxy nucleic acid ligase)
MPIQQVFQPSNAGTIGSPVKVWTDHVEETSMQQLRDLACMPFIFKHIAVMPDVHWGNGTSVGTVIATKGAIIPAAVGVDIGCGMSAVKLNLIASDLPDNLGPMRSAIEAAIPHGRSEGGGANDRGAWGNEPERVAKQWATLMEDDRLLHVSENHPKLFAKHALSRQAPCQLGTLGTGNHFVEICLDKADNVWLMLHSGSRGIGNRIGTYFIDQAKELMAKYFIRLNDKQLSYLPSDTELFADYWHALSWAQDYARVNREIMTWSAILAVRKAMNDPEIQYGDMAVNCHHNYATLENHYGRNVYITRKGAVRAREGDLGIIPGSMGAKSFIVRGLGNPESFCSCSHGAGRRMSRSEAKRCFTEADVALQTQGVECRKDNSVVDEIPGAYKDIQQVMDFQSDLVEVVAELKQVLCVKG